jgi:hypothetical protein
MTDPLLYRMLRIGLQKGKIIALDFWMPFGDGVVHYAGTLDEVTWRSHQEKVVLHFTNAAGPGRFISLTPDEVELLTIEDRMVDGEEALAIENIDEDPVKIEEQIGNKNPLFITMLNIARKEGPVKMNLDRPFDGGSKVGQAGSWRQAIGTFHSVYNDPDTGDIGLRFIDAAGHSLAPVFSAGRIDDMLELDKVDGVWTIRLADSWK